MSSRNLGIRIIAPVSALTTDSDLVAFYPLQYLPPSDPVEPPAFLTEYLTQLLK